MRYDLAVIGSGSAGAAIGLWQADQFLPMGQERI